MAPQDRERRVGQQPPTSLLGQLALQGCPDALARFTTAAHWPPVAVLEPDDQARRADEGDHVHAGDAGWVGLGGEQLEAQIDRCPTGLGGPEQDRICALVDHGPTVGPGASSTRTRRRARGAGEGAAACRRPAPSCPCGLVGGLAGRAVIVRCGRLGEGGHACRRVGAGGCYSGRVSRLLVLGGWSDLTSWPARWSARQEIRHRGRAFSLSTAEVGAVRRRWRIASARCCPEPPWCTPMMWRGPIPASAGMT